VRAQAVAPAVPNPSAPATNARVLAGGGNLPLLLSPSTDSEPFGDNVTAFPNPIILVPSVPPNTMVRLLRDNQVVNQILSGSEAGSLLAILDNANGVVPPGNHTYVAEVMRSTGAYAALARGIIGIEAPEAAPVTAGQAATAFSSEVMRQFGSQFAALATPSTTRLGAPAPVAAVTTPSNPTSSPGNQITLNQFFGHTKIPAAPATTATPRRSLFHHKSRSTIRTVDVSGLDTVTAAATTAAPQSVQGTPNAPATTPPSLGSSSMPVTSPASSPATGTVSSADRVQGTGK
jgi:hypothetical protein